MRLEGLSFPDGLWYAPEHNLWLREEPDGEVTLGLSAYGAALYGDIFAFTPKRIGLHIDENRSFGVVEFAKAASSARSPLSGVVVAHNEQVLDRPLLISRDCYGDGWMIRLQPDAWDAARQKLLKGEQAVAAFNRQAELDGFDPKDTSVQALKQKR